MGIIATIRQRSVGYWSSLFRAMHFFARGNPQAESSGANTTGVHAATVVIV